MSRIEVAHPIPPMVTEIERFENLCAHTVVELTKDDDLDRWVLTVSPPVDESLIFEPLAFYALKVSEINDAIRSAWGQVTSTAIAATKDRITTDFNHLETLIPAFGEQTPDTQFWLPTEKADVYEYVHQTILWKLVNRELVRVEGYHTMHLTRSSFTLTAPTDEIRKGGPRPGYQEPAPEPEPKDHPRRRAIASERNRRLQRIYQWVFRISVAVMAVMGIGLMVYFFERIWPFFFVLGMAWFIGWRMSKY